MKDKIKQTVYLQACDMFQKCDVLLKEYIHNTGTGKRADHGDLLLCSACCDGIGCNKDQCSKVIKSMLAKSNF